VSDVWPGRVAIVGAGTLGAGIAQVFASNGIATALVDSTPERSEAAQVRSLELLSRLEEAGHVDRGAVATARATLSVHAAAPRPVRRGQDGPRVPHARRDRAYAGLAQLRREVEG